jgi:Ca2+-binding EF-hand superfamily protein
MLHAIIPKKIAGGSRALRKAFSEVDLDGNGHLDYYELCQALKVNSFVRERTALHNLTHQFQAFNIVVNEEECQELFVSLGANERGWIEYNDFRRAVEEASAAW